MEITNIKLTILIFIISSLGLYYSKPKFVFNDDSSFKSFGTNENKTLLPFWLITTSISIGFYIFLIINKGEYI